MSSSRRAWLVAASVGAVEALKDQGFCRWNYTIRSLHHHAKNNIRSLSQAKKLSSQSSAVVSRISAEEEKLKASEESLRKVMYLSCWDFKKRSPLKMSSSSRAWLVAASVGAVEALKDQGFCRWNYTIRSLHHHAKNNLRSLSQAKKLSSQSSAVVSRMAEEEKLKASEESLRKVMYLSCWGPY
ncbi:hypothetical protein M9H77_20078 [Catharanthus roseus]|uniref:Uncharacterized protein n=1 Tax=Catharanthus roseus TaxID=4058 RepID=A0ACC0AKG1_CATRO|nr:hypothetical protein M9H77_20078 [Catharanthus roseus]